MWFLDFLMGNQERMVDALTLRGDEGRGMAAINFGEVPSNLDPKVSEWGNPAR